MNTNVHTSTAAHMAQLLLGETAYADLLTLMPGSFFELSDKAQDKIWRRIVCAASWGERDPRTLACFARKEQR